MTSDVKPAVLLVDDQPLVLDVLREALEDAGYDVIVSGTATEARAVLDDRAGHLSALVTDIRLGPEGDGWSVASDARRLNPKMAVVYVTGDSAHEWSVEGVPLSTVIEKPFAPSQVAVAIASLLNRTDDPG